MLIIWINVDNETNNTTIKEGNKIDIPIVNKILFKKQDDSCIDMGENSWIFVTINQLSYKYDL